MADGEIRISTKIDNKELIEGAKKIEYELDEIEKRAKNAQEKIDALNDIGIGKQNEAYKEAAAELEKWNAMLDKNKSRQEASKQQINAMRVDIEEYANNLKKMEADGKYFGDADYDKMYRYWQDATDRAKAYRAELNKSTESGQSKEAEKARIEAEKQAEIERKTAEKARIETEKQAEIVRKAAEKREESERKAAEMAEKNLQIENAKLQKQVEQEAKTNAKAAEEARIVNIKKSAIVSDQNMVNLLEEQIRLEARLTELKKAGVTPGYKEYDETTKRLGEIKKAVNGMPEGFKKLSISGKKAMSECASGAKKAGGMLGTFSTRLKGIALSLLVFNWISKGFNAMVAGIKEGFKNLVQYSDSYNKSISALKSANTQMKNSFATAFAPIVSAAIPHLINLIGYVTTAANYVAQFMAVLSGKSTWTKAKGVQSDYAASLDKTAASAKKAAGALASFDTLEVMNKKDSSGGSGGGSGGSDDMFEEVEIDSGIADSVNKFKELLKGLAEAAQPAIDAFKKLWDEGLSKLKDFAFDTLSDFYHSFLVPVGKWVLGEGLPRLFNITNDLLNEIDWGRLRTSLDNFYVALSKLAIIVLDGLLDFYEYFLKPLAVWTMSEAIPQLVDIMTDFINKVDWEKINKSLERFWKAIEPYAEQFGQGLIDFFSDMKDIGVTIMNAIPTVLDAITKALNEGDPEKAKNWGYALAEVGAAILIIKGIFVSAEWVGNLAKFGGLISNLTWNIAFLEGLAEMKNKTDEINKMEEIAFNAPKKEDYDSLEEYNAALQKYKETVPDLLQENIDNFKIPGVEYDEEGWNTSLVELKDKLVAWCDDVDRTVFGDKFGGMFDGTLADIGKRFSSWWDRDVAPWFTAEKWGTLGQGILDGISMKWNELVEWWNTSALVLWWEENVVPWFTTEKWSELGQGILDGISEKWGEVVTWWDEGIGAWWRENVEPWFTAEKWQKLGENIKLGIYNGFKGILNKTEGILNALIKGFENMCNKIIDSINVIIGKWNGTAGLINSFKIDPFSPLNMGEVKFNVPALANGAVLRGGNPFMAILGDQPAGQTNIEAPADLIRQMVAEGMNQGGQQYAGGSATINLNYDGETFARFFLKDFLSEMNRQGYDIDVLGGLT